MYTRFVSQTTEAKQGEPGANSIFSVVVSAVKDCWWKIFGETVKGMPRQDLVEFKIENEANV